MAFLEREISLAELQDGLACVRSGTGHVSLITGEAGVGKTTLVDTFAGDLDDQIRLLRGACEDLSVAEPLGPLHDLARDAGWVLPPNIEPGNRLSLFSEALTTFTSTEKVTVIIIEDLHWADEATLDFVRFLARRIRATNLYFIVTARNDEEGGRMHLRRAFADVPSGQISRIPLSPLSERAVAELAVEAGRNPGEIYRATGGNAFFVSEMLSDDSDTIIPMGVQDAVHARADRLPDDARKVLDTVSLIPRRAEIDLVRQLCGDVFDEGLSACISRGLLVESGDYVSFRHELARRAIEDSVSREHKLAMNAELYSVLSKLPGVPNARLLHHARRAGEMEAVRRLAPIAAEDAEGVGAIAEALKYWETAIEYAGEASAKERAALQQKLAWCLNLTGRHTDSVANQHIAIELIDPADKLALGDALRKLSRYQWQNANTSEAIRYAGMAIDTLDGHRGPELARAFSNQAQLAMLAYDFDLVDEMAGKALAIADELGRRDIRCHALNNLGLSKVWSDPESGRQLLDESLALALEINSIDDAGRAYVNYAHFEYRRHNYRRLFEIANEGLDYNNAKELDSYYRYLKGTLSWAYLRLGDWEQAETLARESYEGAPPGNQFNHVRFPAALTLAKLEMRRGTGGEAPYFDFLFEFGRRYPELQRLTPIAAATAERSWLAGGDHTAEIGYIEPIVLGVDPCYVAEALIWLERLKPETPVQSSTMLLPVDRTQLDGEYEKAADMWLEIGSAFEAAMALASGDESARRKAVGLLDTLGANASAQRLREYARELGGSIPEPRLSTRTNPAGLTVRQMEVLRLLDEGHSNSKIAEQLFVSPKTIDHHVSAILAKLDASTRSEAAAIARKRGIFSD